MTRERPEVQEGRRYSVKEICAMLHICRDTVRKYTANDTIVAIRITSREIYYLGEEVLRLYEAITGPRAIKDTEKGKGSGYD